MWEAFKQGLAGVPEWKDRLGSVREANSGSEATLPGELPEGGVGWRQAVSLGFSKALAWKEHDLVLRRGR